MAKAKGISGFQEWLPQERLLEQEIIEKVRKIYESHGFVPIETPAVELIETLTSKGEVDKEIYALHRLAAEEGEEAELGLHFDLTVVTHLHPPAAPLLHHSSCGTFLAPDATAP